MTSKPHIYPWPLQAQLVKDRHSLVRMGSLYSDEEEEVVEAPPEKVQMTWTREKCEAERRNRNNAPENFRELMSLKPWVTFSVYCLSFNPEPFFSLLSSVFICFSVWNTVSFLRNCSKIFVILHPSYCTPGISPMYGECTQLWNWTR